MDEIPPEVPGYRLTRRIGRGSTASVWRARRERDEELVAVKLLPGRADEEAVREYALLQHAASEHVVTLHETIALDVVPGLDGDDGGPATALVLELLAGGSLAEVMAERGHLTPGEAVTVIAPVAQALAGLHDLGIVHGDVSPGNVLLDSTGRPSLSDLGYARLVGEVPEEVHGTDGFVAPEVLEGAAPTRAADVYALGALAWQCLVGEPPGHVAERPELADLVDSDLVEVVERCLAGDPQERPDAADVAAGVFDAEPAQPLRMTSPGDVASGLTRRIRHGGDDGEAALPSWQRELAARVLEEEPARVRWWRRWRRQGEARSTRRDRRPPRHGAGSRWLEPGVVARCWVALIGVVATVALVASWQQLASAGDGSTASAEAVTAPAPSRPEGDDVLERRSSVRTDTRQVAVALTDLREEMVTGPEREVARRLTVPGSPAARSDTALVDQLRSSGDRFRGVDLRVRSARLVHGGGRSAVVRARVDEGAYEVRHEDGSLDRHPARRAQQVDLVLAWHEGSWRVREVRPVGH